MTDSNIPFRPDYNNSLDNASVEVLTDARKSLLNGILKDSLSDMISPSMTNENSVCFLMPKDDINSISEETMFMTKNMADEKTSSDKLLENLIAGDKTAGKKRKNSMEDRTHNKSKNESNKKKNDGGKTTSGRKTSLKAKTLSGNLQTLVSGEDSMTLDSSRTAPSENSEKVIQANSPLSGNSENEADLQKSSGQCKAGIQDDNKASVGNHDFTQEQEKKKLTDIAEDDNENTKKHINEQVTSENQLEFNKTKSIDLDEKPLHDKCPQNVEKVEKGIENESANIRENIPKTDENKAEEKDIQSQKDAKKMEDIIEEKDAQLHEDVKKEEIAKDADESIINTPSNNAEAQATDVTQKSMNSNKGDSLGASDSSDLTIAKCVNLIAEKIEENESSMKKSINEHDTLDPNEGMPKKNEEILQKKENVIPNEKSYQPTVENYGNCPYNRQNSNRKSDIDPKDSITNTMTDEKDLIPKETEENTQNENTDNKQNKLIKGIKDDLVKSLKDNLVSGIQDGMSQVTTTILSKDDEKVPTGLIVTASIGSALGLLLLFSGIYLCIRAHKVPRKDDAFDSLLHEREDATYVNLK